MQQSEEYKGHIIEVRTSETGRGRWSWSYTIDGEHYREGSDRPLPSEDLMLNEGMGAARRHVDALEQK